MDFDPKYSKAHLRIAKCLLDLDLLAECKKYLEFFKENFSSTSQSLVALETKLKKREETVEAKRQDNGTEFLLSIFSPI